VKHIVITFTLAMTVLGIAAMKQPAKSNHGAVTVAESCCDVPPPPCPPCEAPSSK